MRTSTAQIHRRPRLANHCKASAAISSIKAAYMDAKSLRCWCKRWKAKQASRYPLSTLSSPQPCCRATVTLPTRSNPRMNSSPLHRAVRRCQLFFGKTLLVAAVFLPSRGHEFSCMAESPSMMDSSGYPIRGPNQDRYSGRNIDSLLATSCGDGNDRAFVSSYRERKRE